MAELTRTELRLPSKLHEQLRQAAFEQHVSLNGLICKLVENNPANAELIALAPKMAALLEKSVIYLAHPDVQAMPFCAPTAPLAEEIAQLLDKIGWSGKPTRLPATEGKKNGSSKRK